MTAMAMAIGRQRTGAHDGVDAIAGRYITDERRPAEVGRTD
jgi:hypothetical protein